MANKWQDEVVSRQELDKVVAAIVACYAARNASDAGGGRVLVGLAGRPGSGKSTVAAVIARAVEARVSPRPACPVSATHKLVCVMPMDGYHLYRRELHAMPNAAEAVRRRGAEWTFSPAKLARDLAALRATDAEGRYRDVYVPSFDHGVGDPCERGICVPASARIVLVEGNYLLYRGTAAWARVNDFFDLTIFLHCDRALCTERLCRRHMAAWGITRAAAMVRAQGSDTINGDLVDTTRGNASLVIHSIERRAASSKL